VRVFGVLQCVVVCYSVMQCNAFYAVCYPRVGGIHAILRVLGVLQCVAVC